MTVSSAAAAVFGQGDRGRSYHLSEDHLDAVRDAAGFVESLDDFAPWASASSTFTGTRQRVCELTKSRTLFMMCLCVSYY